jgi:hypothetical protein
MSSGGKKYVTRKKEIGEIFKKNEKIGKAMGLKLRVI